ncbi:MAG: hypothetical protein FJ379_14810 [Verrucomicrobia bacterium]|nr:hypothetical protein [Verrucomicrobiota bacterium]
MLDRPPTDRLKLTLEGNRTAVSRLNWSNPKPQGSVEAAGHDLVTIPLDQPERLQWHCTCFKPYLMPIPFQIHNPRRGKRLQQMIPGLSLLLGLLQWVASAESGPRSHDTTPGDRIGNSPEIALAPGDLDGDGLDDFVELRFGSDPTKKDTDGDGWDDKAEFDAKTLPRNKDSFPLFTLLAKDQQLLANDLMLLRVRILTNGIVTTNLTVVTNETPVPIGKPVDTDGDGIDDGCDIDGDGAPDVPGSCPESLITTNRQTVTNYVAFQWFHGTNRLESQTNASLVLHRVRTNEAGTYSLKATLVKSFQTSEAIPVSVLDLAPRIRLLQPAGRVLAWGTNQFGQTNVPFSVGDSISLAAGYGHSAALAETGRVIPWGTNDLGQLLVPADATNLVSLSAGASQTMGLRTDGTVVHWGTNAYPGAPKPESLDHVVEISQGYFHSVALRDDGTVVCWGDDTFGQCQVPENIGRIVTIAAGGLHTLALTADGKVVAWGGNHAGQCEVPKDLEEAGLVAAGGNHSIAILRNGAVVAWGDNSLGQLRVPATAKSVVSASGGFDFTAVARAEGLVDIWPNLKNGLLPVPAGVSNIALVESGYFHVLALQGREDVDNDGLDNLAELRRKTDPKVSDTDGDGLWDGIEARLELDPRNADTDSDGLHDWIELQEGFDPRTPTESPDASLWIHPALQLDLFGVDGSPYQLERSRDGAGWEAEGAAFRLSGWSRRLVAPPEGIASYRLRRLEPLPVIETQTAPPVIGTVRVLGDSSLEQNRVPNTVVDVRSLSAGAWHTLALRTDGTVLGWGSNSDGECNPPAGMGSVRALAAGGHFSLAFLEDGTVVGWGRNDLGQISPPTFTAPVAQIAAGFSHGLARLADGTVVGWGRNDYGQATPPQGLHSVTAIDAGFDHSVALRGDGTVVSWGANTFGQSRPPEGLGRVRAIAAGADHTLAVLEDGRVVGWGNNEDGQARPPADLRDVVAVDAAYHRSVAWTTSGKVVVWGADAQRLQNELQALGPIQSVSTGGFHIAVLTQPSDQDGDGLDARLEEKLKTSPENQDTDGDGLGDLLEYLFGFNPLVPDQASDTTVRSGFAVRLRYFTVPSGIYRTSSSTDLQSWTLIGDPIQKTGGYSERLLEAGQVQTYYRLERDPQEF